MKPTEEWRLNTTRLGRRVLVYDRVDSTMTRAAALADDPTNDGAIILAAEQTAGRGQYGRTWACPADAGVLLSVLLLPPPELRRPALLTAWAAVSVCETIRQTAGLQARIKWPNDVLLHGRKVCGILIEQARGVIAGIGLNLNQSAEEFAAAGLPEAASLAVFAERRFDRLEMARALIGQLDEEYDRLCRGDFVSLEACWKWRLGLLGRQVRVECTHTTYEGRVLDLTFAGVELQTSEGWPLVLQPELVRHIMVEKEEGKSWS